MSLFLIISFISLMVVCCTSFPLLNKEKRMSDTARTANIQFVLKRGLSFLSGFLSGAWLVFIFSAIDV
jgi:hypothetical protein